MSRHRNIRNIKDDDLSDEDDVAFSPSSYDGWSGSPSSASPSMSQYFYDRSRTTEVSLLPGKSKPSPLRQGLNVEEEEDTILKSLVSQVLDVVGDQFDEQDAQKALKLHNNNTDKAVNYLLEQGSSGTTSKDDLFEMEMEQPKPSQSKEPMLSFILGITGVEGSNSTSSTQRQVTFSPSIPTTSAPSNPPSSTPSSASTLSESPPDTPKPVVSAPVKTTTPALGRGFRAPHSASSGARGGSFSRPLHSAASKTSSQPPKPQPAAPLTLEDATKIKPAASSTTVPAPQESTSTPSQPASKPETTPSVPENAFTIPLKSQAPVKATKAPKPVQQKDEEDKFNAFSNVGQVPSPLAQTLCDETPPADLSSITSTLFHDNSTDNATSYIRDLYSLLYASIERAVNFAENTKEAVTPFKFDTPSPDDVVQNARKQAVKQKKSGETPKASPAPAQATVSHLSDDLSGMNLGEFSDAPKQPAFKKEALTPVAVKDEVAELKSIDKKQAKQMTPARRKEIEDLIKNRSNDKPHINLVVVGHVDAGKSTLMGHLLYDIGVVSQKVMHKYEKESKNIGKASFSYAWVLDEHEEERNRGITMDIGVTNFETNSRKITLLDAPGHRDFVPNMITGAAQADVALLVIDATTDGFEKGFDSDGQTKEHALLVRSLGVSQLGVAINKLDTVDWSKDRYDFIVSKLGQFLKTSGFSGQSVWFVPCSGLTGENLVKCTEQKLKSWYQGPTLMEKIDNFSLPQRDNDKPFRLCISDIYKAQALGVTIGGKIESGIVSVGDKLLLMPLNEICVVKGIRVHGDTAEFATAGENVDIGLTGLELTSLSVGNFLCSPENPIPLASRFRAKIITFSLQKPILKGQISELHYLTVNEPCNVSALLSVLDRATGEVKKKNPRSLGDNTSAIVEICTQKPICIELKSNFNQIGRFTLRENGRSIAAGIVTEIL